MTLFVFEILCILLYGAASALGAFGSGAVTVGPHGRQGRLSDRRGSAFRSHRHGVGKHARHATFRPQHRHASLVGGSAVVTAVGLLVTRRGLAFSTVAAPVVALLILVSQWLRILDPAGADNMAFYHWPLLVPHIVLVFVALACFATSAVSAAARLVPAPAL